MDNSLNTRVSLRLSKLNMKDGLTQTMLRPRTLKSFCKRKRTSSPWMTGFFASNHGVFLLIRLLKLASQVSQATCTMKSLLVKKELLRLRKLSYMTPFTCLKLITSTFRTIRCLILKVRYALSLKMWLNNKKETFWSWIEVVSTLLPVDNKMILVLLRWWMLNIMLSTVLRLESVFCTFLIKSWSILMRNFKANLFKVR